MSALFQTSAMVYTRPSLFWGRVVTDVSGQPIVPIMACLTLEDGTYRLSRNVGNYQSALLNIPEERSSRTFYIILRECICTCVFCL